MTFKNLFIEHDRSQQEQDWIDQELAEQELRYTQIEQQLQELETARAKWYEEFFDRISQRGFNADGDQKVKIPRAELPAKPEGREDRVLWKYGVDDEHRAAEEK